MSSLDVRSIDEKQLRKQASPATKQEFRVLLSEAAFDRAVARGDGDVTREIGGVLVGELLRDDAGPYLRIDDTIDALHAEEKGAELTFTHATWEHIHKEMDGKHQDKKVVGWYHTHPGFGVFLSDRDQFIHKSFFNLPFQVAFVYDPKSHEHGMFTWHDNEVWRARRYWIGAREQAWDGPRAPIDKARDKPEPEKRKPDRDDRNDRDDGDDGGGRRVQDDRIQGPLGMYLVAGVVLLLLGGVVGDWWGSRSTGQVIEDAQRAIDAAKQDGAQRAIASLQTELVGLVRDTIGDEAVHRPVGQAIAILDQMIAALPTEVAAVSAMVGPAAAPGAAAPGVAAPGVAAPGVVAPGAAAPPRSGSGAAAPPKAGPATVAAATGAAAPGSPTSSGAASGPTAAGGGALPGPSTADPRWVAFAVQLRTVRASLLQLAQDRGSAQAALAQLEMFARRNNDQPREVARELAEQRMGLGAAYAELATDALKAGDKDRARRLLATAAHLDPGNRTRYEKQLQSFEPSGRLPAAAPESAGSAGEGAQR